VKSACKYGLKVGFYYSLWDRKNKLHDTNEAAYVEFMKNQIRKLLSNYGEICEMWFDGFWRKQQSGWKKPITDDTGEKVMGKSHVRDLHLYKHGETKGLTVGRCIISINILKVYNQIVW